MEPEDSACWESYPSHHQLILRHCHHPRGFESPSKFRLSLYLDLTYSSSRQARHSYLRFAYGKMDRGTQAHNDSCECLAVSLMVMENGAHQHLGL